MEADLRETQPFQLHWQLLGQEGPFPQLLYQHAWRVDQTFLVKGQARWAREKEVRTSLPSLKFASVPVCYIYIYIYNLPSTRSLSRRVWNSSHIMAWCSSMSTFSHLVFNYREVSTEKCAPSRVLTSFLVLSCKYKFTLSASSCNLASAFFI